MRNAAFFALCLVLLSVRSTSAESEAARRVAAVFAESGVTPSPAVVAEPRAIPAFVPPAPAPAPLFPSTLWDSLPPLDAGTAAKIKGLNYPGLIVDNVRELSYAQAEPIIQEAAKRELTCLDLFTDAGLRGPHIYYISRRTLSDLYKKYDLGTITLADGTDTDGNAYYGDVTLAGNKQVVMYYAPRGYEFIDAKKREFKITSPLAYTITGDAELTITGLEVKKGWFHDVQGAKKTAKNAMTVDTSILDLTNQALRTIQPNPNKGG